MTPAFLGALLSMTAVVWCVTQGIGIHGDDNITDFSFPCVLTPVTVFASNLD